MCKHSKFRVSNCDPPEGCMLNFFPISLITRLSLHFKEIFAFECISFRSTQWVRSNLILFEPLNRFTYIIESLLYIYVYLFDCLFVHLCVNDNWFCSYIRCQISIVLCYTDFIFSVRPASVGFELQTFIAVNRKCQSCAIILLWNESKTRHCLYTVTLRVCWWKSNWKIGQYNEVDVNVNIVLVAGRGGWSVY